jgi:hypothetical protein
VHDRYLPSDPPTQDELGAAETFLRTYLQDVKIQQEPPVLVATGSSASSLLQVAQQALGLEAQSDRLTQDDLARCQELLCTLPAEEVAGRYDQQLERARILPAGALIFQAVMKRLGLQEIRVSKHGLRHGVLLARERFGENWLEQVSEPQSQQGKASGGQDTNHQDTDQTQDRSAEPFAQFGQDELPKRMKKFLKWTDEIPKHEGTEPVHKMRVASRRLRAALDAYECCCKRKTFKNIYRRTKDLANLLGSVRDTDVMIQGLHTQLEKIPEQEWAGVQWLIQRLEAHDQRQQQALDSALEQLDEKAVKKQIKSCLRKGAV